MIESEVQSRPLQRHPHSSGNARAPLGRALLLCGIAAVGYVAILTGYLVMRVRPHLDTVDRHGDASFAAYASARVRAAEIDKFSNLAAAAVSRRAALDAHSVATLRAIAAHSVLRQPAPLGVDADSPMHAAMRDVRRSEADITAHAESLLVALEQGARTRAEVHLAAADREAAQLRLHLREASRRAEAEHRFRRAGVNDVLEEARVTILTWLFGAPLLIAAFLVYLRRGVWMPLEAMRVGFAELAAGRYNTRAFGAPVRELGQLADQFNDFAIRMQERDAESEERKLERTRRILAAALDAVIVVDNAGLVREWNHQATALFGWDREQVYGVSLAETIFPEDGGDEAARAALAALLTTTHSSMHQRLRAAAQRSDGTVIPIDMGLAHLDGTHGPAAFVVFVRDIWAQELALAAQQDSEARYAAAFDQSAIGMAEIDPSGKILRVNPAVAQILQRTAVELRGLPFTGLLADEDIAADQEALEALVRGDIPFLRLLRAYRRADQSVVWVDLTATPVRDALGALAYIFATVQDVSERVRLEAELRQSQKLEAVGQLAGGVAHDFNNILTGVMGYADLLAHAADTNAQVKHEARAIVSTAQRGAELARTLLSFSRRAPTTLTDVRVRDLVEEVHAIIRRAFDRNIEIALDLESGEHVVRADRAQFSNAVLNLALNARDAMPDGGRLTLRSRRVELDAAFCAQQAGNPTPGEFVCLSVIDTGVGITQQVQDRMFEPFFTTKAMGKGTGLGLAMVYGMVRAHHGVVRVSSRIGEGSAFSLYLPVSTNAVIEAADLPRPLVQRRGHVLLADDESMVRDVVTRMLRRLGFTVDAVADGEQAVARFRATPDRYTFVLLDGDMPRMSGRLAAKEIRQIRAETPLLLATGYLSQDAHPTEPPEGFAAILPKPYTLAKLSQMVEEHVTP